MGHLQAYKYVYFGTIFASIQITVESNQSQCEAIDTRLGWIIAHQAVMLSWVVLNTTILFSLALSQTVIMRICKNRTAYPMVS